MKKFGTKLVAVATAAAMALAFTPSIAFAADTTEQPAEGNTSGSGTMEGHADKDVFCVVLPTVAEEDKTFDFILDPEGLIAETKTNNTNKTDYTDKTFEEGANVFFANVAAGKTTDYSSKSDKLSVINKSTMDVKVAVDATLKNYDGVTLTDDNTFAEDTNASLYMALTDGTNTGKVDSTGKMSLESTIEATEDSYLLKYVTDEYKYVLKDDLDDEDFQKYDFQMTGKCNSADDWADLTAIAPSVDVVWSVTDPNATPAVPSSNGSTPIVINYTGADPAAGSIVFTKPDSTTWTPPASAYTANLLIDAEANTLTLSSAWINLAKSNYGTGTYSFVINGTTYSIVIS